MAACSKPCVTIIPTTRLVYRVLPSRSCDFAACLSQLQLVVGVLVLALPFDLRLSRRRQDKNLEAGEIERTGFIPPASSVPFPESTVAAPSTFYHLPIQQAHTVLRLAKVTSIRHLHIPLSRTRFALRLQVAQFGKGRARGPDSRRNSCKTINRITSRACSQPLRRQSRSKLG